MKKLNKTKVLRISEKQHNTLLKLKSYKVDVSEFIRTAIKEKIKRDYAELLPKKQIEYCPFRNNTIKI
jgi:post-segregation antitoxin (ccd killing protein)